VKHPYDVDDHVTIGESELYVEHIALLYTVFVRADTGVKTQTANSVLNGLWVDNQTRSRVIRETFSLRVAADTTDSQITDLHKEMESRMVPNCNATITVEAVKLVWLTCKHWSWNVGWSTISKRVRALRMFEPIFDQSSDVIGLQPYVRLGFRRHQTQLLD
jgi:small-conductance mechanosensitive channel